MTTEVPDYASGWRGLGDALLRQRKQSEVEQLCRFMERQTGLKPEIHILRSRLAQMEGRIEDARRELIELRRAIPDDLDMMRICCQFHFEEADWHGAQNALEELIRHDPEDGAAYYNLGIVLVQRGDLAGQSIRSRSRCDFAPTTRRPISSLPGA